MNVLDMVIWVKGIYDGVVKVSVISLHLFKMYKMDKYSDNHVKMLCQWALAFSRSEN